MSGHDIFTVYAKEVRDALRDRRTLISMLVVPTLMVPGILLLVFVVFGRVLRRAQAEIPAVMVLGGADSPVVRAALEADRKLRLVPPAADWTQGIIDKRLRAAVEIPAGFDAALRRGEPATVKLYNYREELRSELAAGELRRFFSEYRDRLVADRLTAKGLSPSFIKPFEVETNNVAPPEKVGGNRVGGFVPYLFILLCFTGAMYPAMDLTAGEKERGTMETILCSPIARTDLVLGKFLVVLTVSLTTVAWTLLSSAGTMAIAGSLLGTPAAVGARGAAAAAFTINPIGTLAAFAMVLPIAVLFSAVLMALSLFARTMKEAGSYVTPLIVVVIVPAVMGLLPGIDLTTPLALVPILNVTLASKDLVSGVFHWQHLALIFGSSCLYAGVALAVCVALFKRESVLFRS